VIGEFHQGGKAVRGRYAYITDDYALGSATADYIVANPTSVQDFLIGGSVVSAPTTPLLGVIPDWLDAPLSPIAIGDFAKVTHLRLDPAVAQKDGALLVLTRVPAKNPGYSAPGGGTLPLVRLSTNLIAPAGVDALLVDGVAIDAAQAATASARPTVVVQNGTGVIAMTVIDAGGLDCVNSDGTAVTETGVAHTDIVPVELDQGSRAVRLAIRHLDAPPSDESKLDACFARVALLMIGEHCDGPSCGADLSKAAAEAAEAATVAFDRSSGVWSVTVSAPHGPALHVARGTKTAGDVTVREVDGKTLDFVPLAVNGGVVPLLP
jgi:hypothetical protein